MVAGSLLAYLRDLGVAPTAGTAAPEGPVEELLFDYERYLVLERGLLAESARDYARSVRPFVERFVGTDGIELARLDGPAVVAFVVERCPSQSRSSAKRTVKSLRSLLGFLHVEGYLERPLGHAVPAAGGWRLAGLPRRLEAAQVRRLLGSCDLRTAAGRRDLAVLTVLARLGLRASEIVALSLKDIDWRAGELVVHGKDGRVDRLPLPADAGEAIVAWLRDGGRPSATCRAVFVRRPRAAPVAIEGHAVVDRRPRRQARGPCASRRAPAAPHARERAAAGGRLAAGDRPGAASQPPGDDPDLRQGRSRGAAANCSPVAGSDAMSPLCQSLADYLAVRRALGYRLDSQEKLLGQFLEYLEARDLERITIAHALAWATLPGGSPRWHAKRLRAVRMFARYLRSTEASVEVPPSDLLPDPRGRAVPYIYTPRDRYEPPAPVRRPARRPAAAQTACNTSGPPCADSGLIACSTRRATVSIVPAN